MNYDYLCIWYKCSIFYSKNNLLRSQHSPRSTNLLKLFSFPFQKNAPIINGLASSSPLYVPVHLSMITPIPLFLAFSCVARTSHADFLCAAVPEPAVSGLPCRASTSPIRASVCCDERLFACLPYQTESKDPTCPCHHHHMPLGQLVFAARMRLLLLF